MLSARTLSRIFEHSSAYYLVKRSASDLLCSSLIGRDFINPQDYTCNELKSLLWTAADLKGIFKAGKNKPMDLLSDQNVTLLLKAPHIKAQVAVANAVKMLGGSVNCIIDKRWETLGNVCDGGRVLSMMTDLVIAKSEDHDAMCHLRDGACIPVVSYNSTMFKPLQGLADLLTLQEHYGHLKGLKLAWVGPAEAMFNTYVVMCPRMGMHIQFTCCCEPDFPTSPAMFDVAAKNCIQHNTEIGEFVTAEEAIYRVDVVATTLHDNSNMHITRKMMCDAAVNWTFLHDLPRSKTEVDDDVFYSQRCKAWDSCGNLIWVTMAVVLHCLKDYTPKSTMPNFDGDD